MYELTLNLTFLINVIAFSSIVFHRLYRKKMASVLVIAESQKQRNKLLIQRAQIPR